MEYQVWFATKESSRFKVVARSEDLKEAVTIARNQLFNPRRDDSAVNWSEMSWRGKHGEMAAITKD